jgi:hypothetical protein
MSLSHLRVTVVVAAVVAASGTVTPTRADKIHTGTRPPNRPADLQTLAPNRSLARTAVEYGKISLSIDGQGTTASWGSIDVQKPVSATVRRAYLMAATTGFTFHTLDTGDVSLLGSPVVWGEGVLNSIYSYNYWTDVTAIVKGHIDAAPAGIVPISVAEANSSLIDGEVLAVVFDDPNQTTESTVFLYFGAQNVDGDRFVIDLGQPISKSLPGLAIHYNLGVSFGFIDPDTFPIQYSQVDVNGRRLTTAAGGQDDGSDANGSLITVGGIGDSTDNPPNPYDSPADDPRSDDERYDLLPFVKDGDTSIVIDTYNPSDDDNIFFAALEVTGRSVIGVDVDISLHNNPTTPAARAPYESIIGNFADALYESSNGARKLGKVTFHTLGAYADRAHIVWVDRCHPNAFVSGYGTPGLHINMCDVFRDGAGPGADYDFLASAQNQKSAGYTLAHEWGHYYFSLYDEYVGSASYDSIVQWPHSTDLAVPQSIMNNQWSALAGKYEWLNFSVPKNDTQQTAQFRVYGAPGWPTLTRPLSEDPRTGDLSAIPMRIVHPDLAAVAPISGADAALDLPGDSRSVLSIDWQSSISDALARPATTPYTVQLSSKFGLNISSPQPLVLLAFVHSDVLLKDLGVTATLTNPNSAPIGLAFRDDGVAPDDYAGDGLYAAIVPYFENGIHNVKVTFDNDSGKAHTVATAFQPSTDVNGDPVAIDASAPMTLPLRQSKSIDVVVSNMQMDDHGDTPGTATFVSSDNTPIAGRIDFARDTDVFGFAVPLTGTTFVRITTTALRLNPRIRVFAANGTTVRFQTTRTGIYAAVRLDGVAPGTQLFAEISDVSNSAYGGIYEFSAGPQVASDLTAIAFDTIVLVPLIWQ